MADSTNHVIARVDGCSPISSDEDNSDDVQYTQAGLSIPRQVPILNSLSRQYSSYAWDSNSNRVGITIVTQLASSSLSEDGSVPCFHDAHTPLSMIPNASPPDNDRFQIAKMNTENQRSIKDITPKVNVYHNFRLYKLCYSLEI